jgi:outer membrane receptor protein involved in Fe transport
MTDNRTGNADATRGKHQIAFGVDVLRTRDGQDNHYQDNGVFNFDGRYSNDPLLDFLAGKMNSFSQSGQQLNDLVQTVFMAYVQDTYHVTPRLAANFGLRWEPLLPEHDRYNRGSTFSQAAFDAGQISSVYGHAPAGSLFYGDPGIPNGFTARRMNNLSPRLGLVYNPDGHAAPPSASEAPCSTARSAPSFRTAWSRRIRLWPAGHQHEQPV